MDRPDACQAILWMTIVTALGIAEGKLLWYHSHYRDVRDSAQGLLLQEKGRLRNHRVFKGRWDSAEIFVVSGVLGTERGSAARDDMFLAREPAGGLPDRDPPSLRSRPRAGSLGPAPCALLQG